MLEKWDVDFMIRHKFWSYRVISSIFYQYGTIRNKKARKNRCSSKVVVRYAREMLSIQEMKLVPFEPHWAECNAKVYSEFVADKKYWL